MDTPSADDFAMLNQPVNFTGVHPVWIRCKNPEFDVHDARKRAWYFAKFYSKFGIDSFIGFRARARARSVVHDERKRARKLPRPSHCPYYFCLMLLLLATAARAQSLQPQDKSISGVDTPVRAPLTQWLQPQDDSTTTPAVWGFRDGIQIGLYDGRMPRGLLSVFARSVVGNNHHPLNFIAIEPIVVRARGLSELEYSRLDHTKGKRFWSSDSPEYDPQTTHPVARGTITRFQTTETLQVYIMAEPFDNGARCYLRLTFRSDRPMEVGFETFAAPGCAPMKACILTATMGNYARLRELHLDSRIARASQLWPDYRQLGFAPPAEFNIQEFKRLPGGDLIVSATPDESNPAARTAPGHWNYTGIRAAQYWKIPDDDFSTSAIARVNGRYVYWQSHNPVPGGMAFENFEIQRPFHQGEKSFFGINRDGSKLRAKQ
jgi:hypothetical protein